MPRQLVAEIVITDRNKSKGPSIRFPQGGEGSTYKAKRYPHDSRVFIRKKVTEKATHP